MLPAQFPNTGTAENHTGRVALVILAVSAPRQQALSEWRDELQRLIERHETCPARTANAQLSKLLATAIQNTHEAIAAACHPAEAQLVEDAAATIRRFFTHPGDARAVAVRFPAVAEAHRFLHGGAIPATLHALVRQARECVKLIGRILDGGQVWHFAEPKE